MKLLRRVVDLLEESEIEHCLIGAAAMAAHGAPRSTLDLDLLTTDRRTLDESLWASLDQSETKVQVRRGDSEDPLAGVGAHIVEFGARRGNILVTIGPYRPQLAPAEGEQGHEALGVRRPTRGGGIDDEGPQVVPVAMRTVGILDAEQRQRRWQQIDQARLPIDHETGG